MKQKQSVIAERRQKIKRLFSNRQILQIAELCELFDVSPLTIRRDLEILENEGFIERFRGGGRLAGEDGPLTPGYMKKRTSMLKQKQDIARYVATLVHPGETVFLNAGTTTMEIIQRIKDEKIIIATNNAHACTVMDACAASLISTGGEYNPRSQAYSGIMATELLLNMSAALCVLGVDGISAEAGISSSHYMEAKINRAMLDRCHGLRVVAADSTKIGKTYNFITSPLTNVNLLVTDSGADSRELERFREQGIEVVLADVFS
ncbi:MAG: DeoR/GlpR family DNA-binding transcription regulator [Eubacteriales bacterium]|nr:DeoR/GlpR family DNA-binding transcription regulator [Eubacteriales bacterium]